MVLRTAFLSETRGCKALISQRTKKHAVANYCPATATAAANAVARLLLLLLLLLLMMMMACGSYRENIQLR